MRGAHLNSRAAYVLSGFLFVAGCSSFSPAEPYEPPPAGVVTGEVVAQDGSRAPQVTLTLSQGSSVVSVNTDAGGVFTFPAVVTGTWTLALGALPSTWGLADGQTGSRLVTVTEGATLREEFVLVRAGP